jgi:hypothetical protein
MCKQLRTAKQKSSQYTQGHTSIEQPKLQIIACLHVESIRQVTKPSTKNAVHVQSAGGKKDEKKQFVHTYSHACMQTRTCTASIPTHVRMQAHLREHAHEMLIKTCFNIYVSCMFVNMHISACVHTNFGPHDAGFTRQSHMYVCTVMHDSHARLSCMTLMHDSHARLSCMTLRYLEYVSWWFCRHLCACVQMLIRLCMHPTADWADDLVLHGGQGVGFFAVTVPVLL